MTIEELKKMRRLADECNLVGKMFLNTLDEIVLRVCNGIGPSWFPGKLRQTIDALHPSLHVVAAIHDLWYYYGKGNEDDFHAANEAFADNGIAVAKHLFGWYNPRRYLVMMSARRFARLCDIGGRFAYYSAIAERERSHGDDEAVIEDLISGVRTPEAAR